MAQAQGMERAMGGGLVVGVTLVLFVDYTSLDSHSIPITKSVLESWTRVVSHITHFITPAERGLSVYVLVLPCILAVSPFAAQYVYPSIPVLPSLIKMNVVSFVVVVASRSRYYVLVPYPV